MEGTPQLHKLEDDLSESWIEDFASDGVKELQAFLDNHQAFFAYIYEKDSQSALDEVAELSGSLNID